MVPVSEVPVFVDTAVPLTCVRLNAEELFEARITL